MSGNAGHQSLGHDSLHFQSIKRSPVLEKLSWTLISFFQGQLSLTLPCALSDFATRVPCRQMLPHQRSDHSVLEDPRRSSYISVVMISGLNADRQATLLLIVTRYPRTRAHARNPRFPCTCVQASSGAGSSLHHARGPKG